MQSTAMTIELHYMFLRSKIVARIIKYYLRLKAPRSANNASTPVKASSMPPSDLQPSVLLRRKKSMAKYGEKAFKTE